MAQREGVFPADAVDEPTRHEREAGPGEGPDGRGGDGEGVRGVEGLAGFVGDEVAGEEEGEEGGV